MKNSWKSLSFILILIIIAGSNLRGADFPAVSQFSILESIGRVEERFQGTSKHWVIHIQDVHGHALAQENIAAILEHLQNIYGVSTVALEGAWTQTSLPKSWGLPNSREKQLLARALLEDGYLTGPGYAAIFAQQPLSLHGIEDLPIYTENRDIYLRFLAKKSAAEKQLALLEDSLQKKKETLFNPSLLAFDRKLTAFRKQSKNETFFSALFEQSRSLKLDLTPWPQLMVFNQILLLSSEISKEKLSQEAERLIKSIPAARQWTLEEVLRSGQVDSEKLSYYPAITHYQKLLNLQDQVNHQQLFKEIEELIKVIQQQLASAQEEKDLLAESDDYYLAHHMVLLKATPQQLADFQVRQGPIEALLQNSGIHEELALAVKFYELAKKRDDLFFDQIQNNPAFQQDIALVAGGFHTEGLRQKLRDAGISYMIITPDLGGEAPHEEKYIEHLRYSLKPQTAAIQTLSQILQYMLPDFDAAFADWVRKLAVSKNPVEAVAAIKSQSEQTSVTSAPMTAELFSALPTPTQKEQLLGALAQMKESKEPKLLVLSAPVLSRLIATPLGAKLWSEYVLANKENRVIIAYENSAEIPDAALGLDFRQGSINDVLASPAFLRRFAKKLAHDAAVIVSENERVDHPEILKLPAEEISLLFRIFLDLRQASETPTEWSVLKARILELDAIKAFLESA